MEDRSRSIDELLDEVFRGANAQAATEWMDKYLWLKIVQVIIAISNCPPSEHDLLIQYKCDLKALLKIAQELKVEVMNAEVAAKRLKDLYATKSA